MSGERALQPACRLLAKNATGTQTWSGWPAAKAATTGEWYHRCMLSGIPQRNKGRCTWSSVVCRASSATPAVVPARLGTPCNARDRVLACMTGFAANTTAAAAPPVSAGLAAAAKPASAPAATTCAAQAACTSAEVGLHGSQQGCTGGRVVAGGKYGHMPHVAAASAPEHACRLAEQVGHREHKPQCAAWTVG